MTCAAKAGERKHAFTSYPSRSNFLQRRGPIFLAEYVQFCTSRRLQQTPWELNLNAENGVLYNMKIRDTT